MVVTVVGVGVVRVVAAAVAGRLEAIVGTDSTKKEPGSPAA